MRNFFGEVQISGALLCYICEEDTQGEKQAIS